MEEGKAKLALLFKEAKANTVLNQKNKDKELQKEDKQIKLKKNSSKLKPSQSNHDTSNANNREQEETTLPHISAQTHPINQTTRPENTRSNKTGVAKSSSSTYVTTTPKKYLKKTSSHQDDPRNSRTLFIGNLPLNTTKKDVLKLVSPFGTIESLRQRSAAIGPGKLPVPVARKLGKQLTGTSLNYYIVMATEDSASACLDLNGHDVGGRHIRVDLATPTNDTQRSVFVGNVPFNTEEEELRTLFESCGEVDSVRVIRDSRTGINKGFSYVKFKDRSGVFFACKQNEKIELDGRKLRVFRCRSDKAKGQTKFGGTKSQPGQSSRLVRSVQPGFNKKRKKGGAGKRKGGGRGNVGGARGKEKGGRKEHSKKKNNFSGKTDCQKKGKKKS